MSPVPLHYDLPPSPPPPPPEPVVQPPDRTDELLDALRRLTPQVPPPIVVKPPDLSDIVTAVTSLKPGPSAAEIAAAISDVLLPHRQDDGAPALREVAEALRTLDFRMKGMGRQAYGGGAVTIEPGQSVNVGNVPHVIVDSAPAAGADVTDRAGRLLGHVTVDSAPTTAVTGTFWQGTQPVSLVAVPLPTGAATEATLALLPQKTDKFKYRTDTYTSTTSGTAVDVTAYPLGFFAMQVKGTGAAAATWDVRLEGSLDGTNFSQILQHTNTTGDGAVLWSGAANSVSRYFRSRAAGLTLGSATNVVVSILGKGV